MVSEEKVGCKYCEHNTSCPDAYKPVAVHCGNYDQTEALKDAPYGICSVCGEVLVPVQKRVEEFDADGPTGETRIKVLYYRCPECGKCWDAC